MKMKLHFSVVTSDGHGTREEAIASRRCSFEKARSIAALEGYKPTTDNLEDQERIIRGEISIEDSIAELKKKHACRHTVAA